MNKKNIVIVGAGFSGIYTAKHLARKLSRKKYQIILVDKHSFMTYQTELHEVATERVTPKHVEEDLEALFHKSPNVKLVTTELKKVDAKNKVITTTTAGTIPYEKLVLSIGGESNDFGTPGVKRYGYELWSYEEAIAIREHLRSTIHRGALEADPEKRQADLTIAVVGSGFTGSEVVGELIESKQVYAKEFKLDPNEIKIIMLEAAPTILNMLTKRKLANKAYEYMTNNGVDIRTSAAVTGVTANGVEFKDGTFLPTHSLIWTAGVKNKSSFAKFGLKYEAGRGGRVIVDETMKVKGYDDIYAAGDSVEWVDPKAGPTPQTVEGGESMAATVVKNIVAEAKGNEANIPFKRMDHGFAVSIGGHFTVATLFGFINITGFFASIAKHGINLYYFAQILSLRSIWIYITNEFFRMKDQRDPTWGIVNRQGNTLWALPLRIFMGLIFLGSLLGNIAPFNFLVSSAPFGFLLLALGGMFILGGLTFFASGIAILYTLASLFWSPWGIGQWLIIVMSIALMNGSGRNLGVDKWLQPAAQKILELFWYGKSSTHYNQLTKDDTVD